KGRRRHLHYVFVAVSDCWTAGEITGVSWGCSPRPQPVDFPGLNKLIAARIAQRTNFSIFVQKAKTTPMKIAIADESRNNSFRTDVRQQHQNLRRSNSASTFGKSIDDCNNGIAALSIVVDLDVTFLTS